MRTDIGCCQGVATLSPALMGLAGILNSGTKGLSIFMTIRIISVKEEFYCILNHFCTVITSAKN